MTDPFTEDELSREAEVASAALDGELFDTEHSDLADPEVGRYLTSFSDLATRLAQVEEPPAQAGDRAVATALAAWREFDVEPRRREPAPQHHQPAAAPIRAPVSSASRRPSRHPARRWTRPAVGAFAALLLLVLGFTALDRRASDPSLETASLATVDDNIKQSVEGGLANAKAASTTLARLAENAARAADIAGGVAPIRAGDARSALQLYRDARQQLLDRTDSGTATSTAALATPTPTLSTAAGAPALQPSNRCGLVAVTWAALPTGAILISESVNTTGGIIALAIDPATCAVLAELSLG